MPALELSHHLEDLVVFKNFLEERGIQTTNTRIERYIEYLRQAVGDGLIDAATIFKNSTEGPFQHSTDWMLYVLREVHELMWILKGVKAQVPLGVDEKLRVIVGGSDFAALDADSRSRNTQFELRIASYFCQAGCEVDLSTETDVIALSDDEAFYLECKRVGSVNQLEKRLSEAKKQLSRRMPRKDGKRVTYGCVAVDVTKWAFVHNGLTFAVTNEHSRDVIQEKLIGIANVSQRLPLFRDCRNLASYWFQIHIPSLILQPPITVTRFSSYHIFRDGMNRKDRRATRAFCDIFESVSQGDKRETPPKPLTPRKTFTFPKGTTFSLDEGLFLEFLENGEVKKRDINEEVATLTINDKEHIFTFFEFSMALGRVTAEMRKAMARDPHRARLDIVVWMYTQQFPYEESEGDLYTSSKIEAKADKPD
ncbi:hypothetical protein [Nitrosomonas sp.]|uniref:hypothetical protein n=1 Tax=Nitrosomonas sp. TaxID=42353 RepID=UPI00272A4E45|nr:hypothetical protein [Nitrosomonas sp.]